MSEVPLYEQNPAESDRASQYRRVKSSTSLVRNTPLLGPYSRTTIPRSYGGPGGGRLFLMSEVPLYQRNPVERNLASQYRRVKSSTGENRPIIVLVMAQVR